MPRRPPKKWFDKMKRKMQKQYPSYAEERINKITAGIWHDYSPSTQNRILKRKEARKMGKKKWGKIGAPHSAKRRRFLAKARRKR